MAVNVKTIRVVAVEEKCIFAVEGGRIAVGCSGSVQKYE